MPYPSLKPHQRNRHLLLDVVLALACASIPFLGLKYYDPMGDRAVLGMSFAACLLAVLSGTWIMHSLNRYPGVEATASILSAFSASFGLLILAFLLGRLEYSRIMLVASYVLALAGFFYLAIRRARHVEMRVGVVASKEGSLPPKIWQVEWVQLHSPDISNLVLDAVAVDLRSDLPDVWDRALADYALAGIPVYHAKHLVESLTGRLELEHLSENSLGALAPLSAYMSIKHAVDWVVALVLGLLLLPVFAIIAIVVRLDSSGPVLFRQERIGYRGKPFRVVKFRTMKDGVNVHDEREAAMTVTNDGRITRVGAILRRTRLDELPQILNILCGEMSWIGPRPEAAVLSRWYEKEIPFYRYRHIVRPGITGWAQVNQGHVVDVSEVSSKLHYDFYYIKNFGPWIDVYIIGRTINTLITGLGAK